MAPDDDEETIADRLATQHQWSAAERDHHRDRLYDIRRTVLMMVYRERDRIPASRTAQAIDDFFAAIDARHDAALDQLRGTQNR